MSADGDVVISAHDEVDRDMFVKGEEDSTFAETYGLVEERSVGLKDSYVLALALNSKQDSLAAALSDHTCCLFDPQSLAVKAKSEKAIHDATISGVCFDPTDPNVLFTSSHDATVRVWDVRQGLAGRESRRLTTGKVGGKDSPKPLTALDASGSGRLVCAGTERVVRDTFLLFWDPRQEGALLGGYWESHDDDVTSVRFHRRHHARLASGGTDGVINVFDVAQSSEDDALLASANTESSVQRLCWFGERGLGCVTHTEALHLWPDVDDDPTPTKVLDRDDVCASVRRSASHSCYIVDACEVEERLVVVAGSSCEQNPCLRLSTVRKNRLKPLADLKSGAKKLSALTRTVVFAGDSIYTGAEDGIVRHWRKGAEVMDTSDGNNHVGKVKSKKKKKDAAKNPY